jgi:hypothetical protein
MIRPLFTLITALAAGMAHAEAPQDFRAEYAVYVDGKAAGESTLELRHLGHGRWQHRLGAAGTKGLARLARFSTDQTASLDFPEGRPRLLGAEMQQRSLMKDRDLQVEFDWPGKTVRWLGDINKDEPMQRPLQGIPATGSSLNLQLAFDARHGKPGERVHYVLHDRGRASELDYVIGTAEAVTVPAGTYTAVPLRGERVDKQRVTLAWYDPALPATPVRVLQREDGKDKYELRLVRISGADSAAAAATAAPVPVGR